jgi:hypothetical protein
MLLDQQLELLPFEGSNFLSSPIWIAVRNIDSLLNNYKFRDAAKKKKKKKKR